MKILPFFLSVLVISSQSLLAQTSEVSSLLQRAKRASAGGDPATAKLLFMQVLELQPNNQEAQRYLRTIEVNQPKAAGSTLKHQIDGIKVDSIEFKDTTLDAVLTYLSQIAEKNSQGKVVMSFVQKLPPGYASQTKLSLNLKAIPMSEVLRYVGSLTGTTFTVEKFAVKVELESAAKQTEATNASPDATPAPAGL